MTGHKFESLYKKFVYCLSINMSSGLEVAILRYTVACGPGSYDKSFEA